MQIFLIFLATTSAWADVNLRTGEFSKSFNELPVRRTYYSRSVMEGAFGFGWCAEFEKRIRWITKSELEYSDCEMSQALKFVIDPLDGDYKNPDVSFKFHRQQTIWSLWKEGHLHADFDPEGHLLRLYKKSRRLEFKYDKDGLLKGFQWKGQPEWSLRWNLEKTHIESVQQWPQNFFDYQYLAGNLDKVLMSGELFEAFAYDEVHNLTLIQTRQGTKELISYNSTEDWVKTHSLANGCRETYEFIPGIHGHRASVRRTCPLRPDFAAAVEFTNSQSFPRVLWIQNETEKLP